MDIYSLKQPQNINIKVKIKQHRIGKKKTLEKSCMKHQCHIISETSVVAAKCLKIFDIQCNWGRTFVSLERIFVFNLHRLYFI